VMFTEANAQAEEGYLPFRGFRTWFRIVGQDGPGRLPVLALHGGPGMTHDYMEPLEALSATGRRVVFYDQLGSGNSDQPHDPALWTIPLFVDELATVRHHLGLERVHLFGSSWGGMLAMEYLLTKPTGVASLTLAGSPASMPQWAREANRLRSELPADVQRVITEQEAAGTTDSAEYEDAVMAYYRRHLCRLEVWPDCVNRTFAKMAANPEVYHTMGGSSEFNVTGNIKDWDIVDRLPEIRVPTLVTAGEFDEATRPIVETVHRGIAGSRMKILGGCSHLSFVEDPESYLQLMSRFLDVESAL
jgi:L-proline amide hydrolase